MSIANEQNLISLSDRPPEEARAIQSAGGRACAEAKARRRAVRECLETLLDLPVRDQRRQAKLERMGLDPGDIDNRMLYAATLFRAVIDDGDMNAAREIRLLLGESPGDNDSGMLREILGGLGAERRDE